MLPDDWEKINELFHAALELNESARAKFLRENCGDAAMRGEVVELLSAHERDRNFLQASAFETGLEFIGKPEDFAGERVGAYQIIGELGRGGMGEVFLAMRVDGAFERRVAIKILPRSLISDALEKRFRLERQILANLDHPNIARLFDGGTSKDGLPYLVMEYVRGSRITDFCRENFFSLEERLKLFLKVCETVRYAHAQNVVHRDLKPSNILVDEAGEPKLLDFGIAKFVSNDAIGEATADFNFLTPEYASPEQISGQKITTQTDIYSLGIVLYELLTEARPYDFENRSPAKIVSVICESEPRKPSTIKNRSDAKTRTEIEQQNRASKTEFRINQDLDFIVLKALRKDAARRYTTIKEFAADIERFLKGLPIKAAPDRFDYRARKFFRRHKISMTGTIAAGLSLIFAASLIYWNFNAKISTRKDYARRLTFSDAADDYPHFASDGRIIFTRENESSERLFVINADGGGESVLNENLHADRAAFSPDGKQIAYRSTDDYRIYIARADFSAARQLTHNRAGRFAWFPDANRLLFSYNFSQNLEQKTQPMYEDRDNVEIFSVNADGSNETNLTKNLAFDSDACVSPDGSQIAFASDRDGSFEIYTMNVDGSNIRRLTRNEFEDDKPVFSPDGKRLAFASRRDGDEEIYTMNADGSNLQRITNALGDDREPQWSPDGKQIIFSASGDGNREIYIIDTPAE